MQNLVAAFSTFVAAHPSIITIGLIPLLLVLADVVTGGIRAAKHKSFRLDMLANFAGPSLGKYFSLLATGILSVIATGQNATGALIMIHGILMPWYAAQVASIDRNISLLTGADEGMVNAFVNRFLGKFLEGGTDEKGPPPPATVAASAGSLAPAMASTASLA